MLSAKVSEETDTWQVTSGHRCWQTLHHELKPNTCVLFGRPGSISFDPSEALYSVQLPNQGQPFSFAVKRNEQQQQQRSSIWQQIPQQAADDDGSSSIFDTSGSYLVFKKQYMELRTNVPATTDVYGLGQ